MHQYLATFDHFNQVSAALWLDTIFNRHPSLAGVSLSISMMSLSLVGGAAGGFAPQRSPPELVARQPCDSLSSTVTVTVTVLILFFQVMFP